MAIPRKHILIAGLGRYVAAEYEAGAKLGTQKSNRQMETEKAKEAGYECTNVEVNPATPEESLKDITDILKSRHFELFVVGFGLRSNPTLTPLFEQVVNACVEVSPKTKLGFAPTPNDMCNTITRVLK